MPVQWIRFGATLVLVAMTLLPLSRISAWWVRGLDFPRLQLSDKLDLRLHVPPPAPPSPSRRRTCQHRDARGTGGVFTAPAGYGILYDNI